MSASSRKVGTVDVPRRPHSHVPQPHLVVRSARDEARAAARASVAVLLARFDREDEAVVPKTSGRRGGN